MSIDDDPDLKARRAASFGAVAEAYDAARPTYPPAFVDALVERIPGRRVAEIGAGTGIATRLLAARGLRVTAVEPDPAMAAVLRRRSPGLEVVETTFERWRPATAYDGLLAAQAWHWTDPDGRCERAAAALRPGGVIALWWNLHGLADDALQQAATKVYDDHGVSAAMPFDTIDEPRADHWPGDELAAAPEFGDVEVSAHRWRRPIAVDALLAHLETTSQHRIMAGHVAGDLRAALRALLAAAGEQVILDEETILYTARRVES